MGDSVGVVIPTFGDKAYWGPLAARAIASAINQSHSAQRVLWKHAGTLAEARNEGAAELDTEWLIFLDADDELDERYIESMLGLDLVPSIRRPSTLGVVEGVEDDFPVLLPRTNLLERNFVVIGAMMPRETFWVLGGFEEYPVLEDWALFLKAWIAGVPIVDCPEAIYRVHVRSDSRNKDHGRHNQTYAQIRDVFSPLAAEKGLV